MAYAVTDIIVWSKISQPLARRGETLKQRNGQPCDIDLDMKLYNTRIDVQYEYDQDPTSDNLFAIANYLLTLCGIYLFQAQQTTVGGGTISPVTPATLPAPYYFFITASSTPLANGQSSATLSSFIGFNLIFNRNGVPQTTIVTEATYFTWDRSTGLFTCSPAATSDELFALIPA